MFDEVGPVAFSMMLKCDYFCAEVDKFFRPKNIEVQLLFVLITKVMVQPGLPLNAPRN